MGDRTEAALVIDAPAAAILDVVADVERYPEWANGIKEAEVLETAPDGRPAQARFRIDAGPVKDEYVIAYTWAEDGVTWSLVRASVLTAMDGAYTLSPADGGTEVGYRLTVDLAMPMLGLIKRKAERAVVDTALKDLRRRVEG